MAQPRIELGHHPRQGYSLPLAYWAFCINNVNQQYKKVLKIYKS